MRVVLQNPWNFRRINRFLGPLKLFYESWYQKILLNVLKTQWGASNRFPTPSYRGLLFFAFFYTLIVNWFAFLIYHHFLFKIQKKAALSPISVFFFFQNGSIAVTHPIRPFPHLRGFLKKKGLKWGSPQTLDFPLCDRSLKPLISRFDSNLIRTSDLTQLQIGVNKGIYHSRSVVLKVIPNLTPMAKLAALTKK